MGHNYSQINGWGPVGGQRGPQPSHESERAHRDEVCAADNLSEVSIPGRANTMRLGGKKKCASCSVDLLTLGMSRAYTVMWGATMSGVLSRGQVKERSWV